MSKKLQLKWMDYIALGILLLLPFLHVSVGVDLMDSGYSLGNYANMQSMDATWVVATFYANCVGRLFTLLPYGGLWMGMNVYCTLILCLILGMAYLFVRKMYSFGTVFAGELLALSLCWCPHVILYNYLTYLLMNLGIILLLYGVSRKKHFAMALAGFVLASNVYVRFPNVVQCLFIVVVWYDCFLHKKGFRVAVKETLICILGYLVGLGMGFGAISLLYGRGAFTDMISSLFGMTKEATSYTPMAMVELIIRAYLQEIKMALLLLLGCAILTVVYSFFKGKLIRLLITATSVAFYLGFLYGGYRKMLFVFNYLDYRSINFFVTWFLILSIVVAITTVLSKKADDDQKLMAVVVLLIIALTPLGSNNGVYPAYNNLFLVAPFTFLGLWKFLSYRKENKDSAKKKDFLPVKALLVIFTACLCFQSAMFGLVFTFCDNGFMINTDKSVAGNERLQGMHTNEENAKMLEEITAFIYGNGYRGSKTICYGNIPAMNYVMDLPGALSHTWPDLASYPIDTMKKDMESFHEPPLVIVNLEVYEEILDSDENAANPEKTKLLADYMRSNHYNEIFRNNRYAIYEVSETN